MLPWIFSSTSEPHPEAPSDDKRLLNALRHFEVPGSHPPHSRVDPHVPQREPGSLISIRNMWKLGLFLSKKSREVVADIVAHNLYGPKRPTWGIEMTIISSLMRNLSQHSELTNIVMLRAMMAIGGMVPTPSDALVTSVTFPVRRRNLPGILAEFDAQEDGTRELTGEWVVGRKLWLQLQHEWSRSHDAGVRSGKRRKEKVMLYLHGGAYYVFSAATHRSITIRLSKQCGVRVFAINYRLAPETRFPGPLHDAVTSYFRLIEDLKIPPENIVIAGDSAGGGLTLALLMYLRDHRFPMPAGAILMSPWVDLTMSCESWESNAAYDVIPIPQPADHMNPVYCYLGEEGLRRGYATHPYASPLFGDFKGLPPMLIQSGEAEALRDEITLLAYKARKAGVETVHELYQDAVHVFQVLPFLPTAQQAYESCREFMNEVLPRLQAKQSKEWSDDGMTVDEETGVANEERVKIVDATGEVTGEGKEAVEKAEEEEQKTEEEGSGSSGDAQEASGTQTPRIETSQVTSLDEETARQRRRSEHYGTSVDGGESSMFGTGSSAFVGASSMFNSASTNHYSHTRTPSNRYVLLPRSKSAAYLPGATQAAESSMDGGSRRHARQASMHTPGPSSSSHLYQSQPQRITLSPLLFMTPGPKTPSGTASGDDGNDTESEDEPHDANNYFARTKSPHRNHTAPGTPAPSIRKRGRSATMSSEVDDLCREWLKMSETDSADVKYWPS